MKGISYTVSGNITRARDVGSVDSLHDQIIDTIALDVKVELGGKKVSLAMLLDPSHWEGEWEEIGVDDVDEFIAGLVEEV